MAEAPSSLGELLRRERLRRGERQVDTASRFDIHQTSYYRWESGETVPDPSRYGEVADFLGLSVQEVWVLAEGTEMPTSLEALREEVSGLQRQIADMREILHNLADASGKPKPRAQKSTVSRKRPAKRT